LLTFLFFDRTEVHLEKKVRSVDKLPAICRVCGGRLIKHNHTDVIDFLLTFYSSIELKFILKKKSAKSPIDFIDWAL
jgi:menaquinone-dependent protoporphyrinogen IX oxidase